MVNSRKFHLKMPSFLGQRATFFLPAQALRRATEVQILDPKAAERLGRVLLDQERQGPGMVHREDHWGVVLSCFSRWKRWENQKGKMGYPLVIEHSKSGNCPFIVDLPIKDGDFP